MKRTLRTLTAAAVALALAACAAPGGMGVGLSAPAGDSAAQDLSARADILALNPETIARVARERAAAQDLARAARKTAAEAPWQYRVGAGDVLRVTIWNYPELNNPASTANELAGRVVNDDGKFFYPYAGAVPGAGRTVVQIRDDLTKALGGVLKNPQIDVGVSSYRSQKVAVVGEVKNPITAPVSDVPLRITDALTAAGGYTTEADLAAALVQRGPAVLPVDLYGLYFRGDMSQNLRLQNGDVLNIPDRRYNKVFVLGEVIKPSSLPMPRGRMSLTEALADVGGTNPLTANDAQIYVIRARGEAKPQIFHLNAKSADALLLADAFDLQARDVVYVDPVPVVRWNRLILQILPTLGAINSTVDTFAPRAAR